MYGLLIVGGDARWRDELWAAVKAEAERVLGTNELMRLDQLPAMSAPAPTVVVYLGDEAAARDDALGTLLEQARTRAFGVLPVVHDLATTMRDLPSLLHRLNAMSWDDDPDLVVGAVLRQLGIAERERKLFLSYRRTESSAVALQLRRALTDRSYDVFLDRFSVPPGDDFQRRLDIELADKAFVLLLETAGAADSEWIQHEVTYALSHRLALLALTFPDAPDDARFSSVEDGFRYSLTATELTATAADADCQLTCEGLATVLQEIETRHATKLRERRKDLLGSVEAWLRAKHRDSHSVGDWALASTDHMGNKHVWLITPRAPVPADLRQVDLLRRQFAVDSNGIVVHETPVLDPDDEALISWIVENRSLGTTHLQAVPTLLAA